MEKLKKLPTAVWLLIEYVALILRELYLTITTAYTAEEAAEFNAIYNEMGFAINIAPVTLTIVDCIVLGLVSMLIFEVITSIFYALLLRRGLVQVNREEFKFSLRIYHIMAAIAIGIVSMIYFAIPDAYVAYMSEAIGFTINTAAVVVCAWKYSKDWFAPKRTAIGYRYCWMMYFIVSGVLYLGSMVGLLILGYLVKDIIAEIVLAVNVVILAPLALLPYFSLKKIDETTVLTQTEAAQQQDEEIFRDLGL